MTQKNKSVIATLAIALGSLVNSGAGFAEQIKPREAGAAANSTPDVRVKVDWARDGGSASTVPSFFVVPEPPIRKGRLLHSAAMAALRSTNAHFVRYMPYCTHPRLSIAELQPPTKDRTYWDFSLIDPELIAFLDLTRGREPVVDFGPIPPWMFKSTGSPVYASDPDAVDWAKCGFPLGTDDGNAELADPTGGQVAEYFARIFSWYTRGGFTDELGKYHASGYHYELPWWGVLNEPNGEHAFTPEQYTKLYDAVVAAIHEVNPSTKFDGLELEGWAPEFIEYFLEPTHHAPGTPIDMVSFHFYAVPVVGQSFDSWEYTVFDQFWGFEGIVEYIDSIRKRLSPTTKLSLGESGIYFPEDERGAIGKRPIDTTTRTPLAYWYLSAAFYANAFIELSRVGVDVVSASNIVGYPPAMFPSLSLIDLNNGSPRPTLLVVRLLNEQLPAPRRLVPTTMSSDGVLGRGDIAAQAFVTAQARRLLLVNKRSRAIQVEMEQSGQIDAVVSVKERGSMTSGTTQGSAGHTFVLSPFEVAIVTFK